LSSYNFKKKSTFSFKKINKFYPFKIIEKIKTKFEQQTFNPSFLKESTSKLHGQRKDHPFFPSLIFFFQLNPITFNLFEIKLNIVFRLP
jgi:hypothetical protein